MNKLYILGALLLSSAEAGKLSNVATAASTGITTTLGSYSYAVSADCLASLTPTTLGLNNKYYQYYSFPIAFGSVTWAANSPVTISPNFAGTFKYSGCYHTHLANWMATPAIVSATAVAGLGNQAVAYGYVLSGTAVTSCANTIATSTLYSATSKAFYGAQYQSVNVLITPITSPAVQTITTSARIKQGTENYDSIIVKGPATIIAFTIGTGTSNTVEAYTIPSTSISNYYWDFMQTNVFQGMTQFGRGGGASTAPCGWWVIYALEQPGAIQATGFASSAGYTGAEDGTPTFTGVTVNMWTDNSIVTVASSIVLSALATILF